MYYVQLVRHRARDRLHTRRATVDGLVKFGWHRVVLRVRLGHAAVCDFGAPAVGHALAKGFLNVLGVAVGVRARVEALRELVADPDRRECVGTIRHDVLDEEFVHGWCAVVSRGCVLLPSIKG